MSLIVILSWLIIIPLITKSVTMISDIWIDDFMYDINGLNGWSNDKITNGTLFKYHGFFGVDSKNLTRHFSCNQASYIQISFTLFYGCDIEENDGLHFYLNNQPQLILTYSDPNHIPYDISGEQNLPSCYHEDSIGFQAQDILNHTINDVVFLRDEIFEIKFMFQMSAAIGNEFAGISNIIIQCIETSTTTVPPTTPTLEPTYTPTLVPTLTPTNMPTMEPTHELTIGHGNEPTMEPTLNPTQPSMDMYQGNNENSVELKYLISWWSDNENWGWKIFIIIGIVCAVIGCVVFACMCGYFRGKNSRRHSRYGKGTHIGVDNDSVQLTQKSLSPELGKEGKPGHDPQLSEINPINKEIQITVDNVDSDVEDDNNEHNEIKPKPNISIKLESNSKKRLPPKPPISPNDFDDDDNDVVNDMVTATQNVLHTVNIHDNKAQSKHTKISRRAASSEEQIDENQPSVAIPATLNFNRYRSNSDPTLSPNQKQLDEKRRTQHLNIAMNPNLIDSPFTIAANNQQNGDSKQQAQHKRHQQSADNALKNSNYKRSNVYHHRPPSQPVMTFARYNELVNKHNANNANSNYLQYQNASNSYFRRSNPQHYNQYNARSLNMGQHPASYQNHNNNGHPIYRQNHGNQHIKHSASSYNQFEMKHKLNQQQMMSQSADAAMKQQHSQPSHSNNVRYSHSQNVSDPHNRKSNSNQSGNSNVSNNQYANLFHQYQQYTQYHQQYNSYYYNNQHPSQSPYHHHQQMNHKPKYNPHLAPQSQKSTVSTSTARSGSSSSSSNSSSSSSSGSSSSSNSSNSSSSSNSSNSTQTESIMDDIDEMDKRRGSHKSDDSGTTFPTQTANSVSSATTNDPLHNYAYLAMLGRQSNENFQIDQDTEIDPDEVYQDDDDDNVEEEEEEECVPDQNINGDDHDENLLHENYGNIRRNHKRKKYEENDEKFDADTITTTLTADTFSESDISRTKTQSDYREYQQLNKDLKKVSKYKYNYNHDEELQEEENEEQQEDVVVVDVHIDDDDDDDGTTQTKEDEQYYD